MRKGEGVGQGGPRQERHYSRPTVLGSTEEGLVTDDHLGVNTELTGWGYSEKKLRRLLTGRDNQEDNLAPAADDRDQPAEVNLHVGLGERVTRALSYMRDLRFFPNGMRKPDRNRATEENVDEARRAPRIVVKERALRGNTGVSSQITETVLTGRRARFDAQTKLPIPDADKETVRPEDVTLSTPEGIDIYVARDDDEPADPVRLERRGNFPPSADQLSDGPTAEEVEREAMEAFEYVETAEDLRS